MQKHLHANANKGLQAVKSSIRQVASLKLGKYSKFKFGLTLGIGVLVALVLCVQCVRTYLYTDSVLVPQQAEREAERQVGALTTAARSAGINDPHALGPVIEHAMEAASDRVLWMRVVDPKNNVLAQGGSPQGTPKISPQLWNRVDRPESPGALVDTPLGQAWIVVLPFRLPRPPPPFQPGAGRFDGPPVSRGVNPDVQSGPRGPRRPSPGDRPVATVIELAIPRNAVLGAFEGLRQNLIVGLIASIALLTSLGIIGLRAPHYLRGKYLEGELQLARRVQNDLQPKPHSASLHLEFAASAVAADHVGGDFYDIFEAEPGKIGIVLGDVSGKGVPAALLVSVLHGAIRSSMASDHAAACERINRMLCERTACERFATLFWGIFDPKAGILHYVNAGHAAPMLVRHGENRIERLDEGGPVLGLLPTARYSAGTVAINALDTLILYSDGISEAANQSEQEFGEERMEQMILDTAANPPAAVCERIMNQVTAFANAGAPADDQTLLVVKFPESGATRRHWKSGDLAIAAVA